MICGDHLAGECHKTNCPNSHEPIQKACWSCGSITSLSPLAFPSIQGTYGRVSLHNQSCDPCGSSRHLALKVTANITSEDMARNSHELSTWQKISDIPGIVPLLGHQAMGDCFIFFMPRMTPLSSLKNTTLTFSFKLSVIKRMHAIISELFCRGFVYSDGGCKQVLFDPPSGLSFLADFGGVNFGAEGVSVDSLKIMFWELRVEFKGHAEKLKNLEIQTSLAQIGQEISKLSNI